MTPQKTWDLKICYELLALGVDPLKSWDIEILTTTSNRFIYLKNPNITSIFIYGVP